MEKLRMTVVQVLSPPIVQILFWLCAATVLYLSLSSGKHLPTTGWDKSNHVLAFATLTILGSRSWPGALRRLYVALIAHGSLIEVLQSFTPTRQADWHDLVADAVGIILGVLVLKLSMRLAVKP